MSARRNLRATVANSATTWEGTVIAANLYARALTVNTKDLGTFNATISRSVDVGTPTAPKIHVGDTVRVERMRNHYLVTDILAKAATQISNQFITYSPQVIEVPEWVPPYPRIVGTQLEGLWTVVAEAIKYRVYSNTTPSQVGATLVGEFFQNQFSQSLNRSYGELISDNRGFENGDLRGWNAASVVGWKAVSGPGVPHGGNFSASSGQSVLSTEITSNKYRVGASKSYTANVWVRGQWNLIDLAYRTIRMVIKFYDASDALISTITQDGDASNDNGWQQIVKTGTTPANTVYFDLTAQMYDSTPGGPFGYFYLVVDDASFGSYEPVTSNLLYAVRAVGQNGVMSPFSSWQQPTVASGALGDPTLPHGQIDYANALIQSSNFSPGTAGFKISPSGVEGACVISATEPATMFPGLLWLDTSV